MKFFEICAEVLVPKFTRAEVRLPDQTMPWFRCWAVFLWWHGHAFISAIKLRHPKQRLSFGQLSSETTVSYLRDLFLYRFVTNISNQQIFALWYFWHSNWGWNQSLLFGRFFNLLTSLGFYGSNFSKVDSKLFKVGALILAKTHRKIIFNEFWAVWMRYVIWQHTVITDITVSYCKWVTVRLLILPEYGGGWNK